MTGGIFPCAALSSLPFNLRKRCEINASFRPLLLPGLKNTSGRQQTHPLGPERVRSKMKDN